MSMSTEDQEALAQVFAQSGLYLVGHDIVSVSGITSLSWPDQTSSLLMYAEFRGRWLDLSTDSQLRKRDFDNAKCYGLKYGVAASRQDLMGRT